MSAGCVSSKRGSLRRAKGILIAKGGTDSERWQRLRELFDAAMDLEASERPSFVARSCLGDPELQSSLESLLAHSAETGTSFGQAMQEVLDPIESLPTRQHLAGRTLGHYRIVEKIGQGGMGEVFRAHDSRLGRDVAIKVLPDGFTRDPERLARFEREARVLASLNHPNIATIFGIEETDGVQCLVLELIEGETLRCVMNKGQLPLNTVIRYAGQIAAGLAKAHAAGIVHRDLKPENLMLTEDGFIKILDFGIAKAAGDSAAALGNEVNTATGRVMGTASYMSPEQARGEPVDHRSDQFAFGSVLFEMVTGQRAFGGETDADSLVAVMRSEPDLPEDFETRVPRQLRAVIERCLAKEPGARYESTLDLARDLRHLKTLFWEIIESEVEAEKRPRRASRKKPVVPAAIATLSLLMIAAFWWQLNNGSVDRAAAPGEALASIAVLPLENLGPEDQEYFADGMTDALITHLSKIEALTVISRTTVMRYKNSDKPLPEIADELGVETVLSGSVLHAGGRVRISTVLSEGATDRNLWADDYEEAVVDILSLQGEVARAIAEAVKVEVSPEVAVRIADSREIDVKALDAYLKGLAASDEASWARLTHRDSIRSAIAHYQRAIELEPGWAEAHARLADSYRWLAAVSGPDIQTEYYPEAKETALRALDLDRSVALAHRVLAYIALHREWDWETAERYYERSIEFDPNGSSWAYARFLTFAGRFEEAWEYYERARQRNPEKSNIHAQVGWAYLIGGRIREAESIAQFVLERFPSSNRGYGLFGLIRLYTSRYDEAVTYFEKASNAEGARMPSLTAQLLPLALAKAGRVGEAREMLGELEGSGLTWFPELYWVLGERDKAMAQIEAAFAVRRDILMGLRSSSEYESFMENPRFREIVEEIGFPY